MSTREKILLVEDNTDCQILFQAWVTDISTVQRPVEVVIAATVQDAINAFRQLITNNLNSVFLDADLGMGGNGHNAFKEMLRINPAFSYSRIMSFSTIGIGAKKAYEQAGVPFPNHFLTKEFDNTTLVKVKKFILGE